MLVRLTHRFLSPTTTYEQRVVSVVSVVAEALATATPIVVVAAAVAAPAAVQRHKNFKRAEKYKTKLGPFINTVI